MFGGGAGQGVMAALAGRLLCDTYLSGIKALWKCNLPGIEVACCACAQ